jgi:DNA polymerase III delta prime subunit
MENISMFDGFITVKNKINKYNNIKLPWVEKYRPINSSEILLDPFIKTKIDKILETKSIPNLIITGEPGTGKTSTIICLAKQLYSEKKYDEYVLELNASDDRGLDIVHEKIIPFCKSIAYDLMGNKLNKVIIFDEADNLTKKAQEIISNLIKEYSLMTRFIFICNNRADIDEKIQSRCFPIYFPSIGDKINSCLKKILNNENIKMSNSKLEEIVKYSNGDIRLAINLIQIATMSNYPLDSVSLYTFNQHLEKIVQGLFVMSFQEIYSEYNKIVQLGFDGYDIIQFLIKKVSNSNITDDIRFKAMNILYQSFIVISDEIESELQIMSCMAKLCK